MRISLEEVIKRHKKVNPNTDYDYSETVLGKTLHSKVKIICREHGTFMQSPHEHMKGQGCPECGKIQMRKTKTSDVELMIKRSKELFKDKFDYEITRQSYVNIKSKCLFHCKKHNFDFKYTPSDHLHSKFGGCKMCRMEIANIKKEIKEQKRKEKILEKQKIKEEKTRIENLKRVEKENKKKKQEAEKLRLIEEKEKYRQIQKRFFIKNLKNIYNNKFDISYIDNYIDNNHKVKLFCNEKDKDGNYHGLFEVTPNKILLKNECPKCQNKRAYHRTAEELITLLNEVHNNRYTYADLENKVSRDFIFVKCIKCGKQFRVKLSDHLKGSGCPYCRRSRLELFIEKILDNNNIKNQPQKTFEWLINSSANHYLYLDFYLPEYNVGIECQGKQHFEPVEAFGGHSEYYKVVKRDKLKKQLCKEHNIKLIYYLSDYFVKYLDKDDLYFTNEKDLINFLGEINDKKYICNK